VSESTPLKWSPSLGLTGTTVDGSVSLPVLGVGVVGAADEEPAFELLSAGLVGAAEPASEPAGASEDELACELLPAGVVGVTLAPEPEPLSTSPITLDAPPMLVSSADEPACEPVCEPAAGASEDEAAFELPFAGTVDAEPDPALASVSTLPITSEAPPMCVSSEDVAAA